MPEVFLPGRKKRLFRLKTIALALPVAQKSATKLSAIDEVISTSSLYQTVPDFQRVQITGDYASGVGTCMATPFPVLTATRPVPARPSVSQDSAPGAVGTVCVSRASDGALKDPTLNSSAGVHGVLRASQGILQAPPCTQLYTSVCNLCTSWNPERLSLAGTSAGHLVQPLCSGGVTQSPLTRTALKSRANPPPPQPPATFALLLRCSWQVAQLGVSWQRGAMRGS